MGSTCNEVILYYPLQEKNMTNQQRVE